LKTRKLLAMLVAVAMIVTMLPVVAFAANGGSFEYDVPSVIYKGEEVIAKVTFTSDTDYEGVRFAFKVEGPGNVTLKATDSKNVEHTFINKGYWGPSPGFNISSGYNATTEWTITFDRGGKYEFTNELIKADGSDILLSDTIEITVIDPTTTAVTGRIYADDDEYDVEKDVVELTVHLRNRTGEIPGNLDEFDFYVWAEREKDEFSVVDFPADGGNDCLVKIEDEDVVNGVAKVSYKSNYAGEVTFFLGRLKRSYGESDVVPASPDKLTKLDSVTVEFVEDTEVYEIELVGNKYYFVNNPAPADGITAHKVTFKVTDGLGFPVKGEKVNFDVDSSRVALNKESAVTNSKGEVEVKATSERAGEYTLTAELDSARNKEVEVNLKFTPSAAYDIKVKKGDGALVALDQPYTFEFVVYDLFGRVIKGTDDDDTFDNYVLKYIEKIEVPTCPDKAAIDKSAPYVDAEEGYVDSNVVEWASNGNLKVNIPGDDLNKEGEYALRVKLQRGKYATANFKVTEQGEIVDMSIEYDPDYIAYRLIEVTEEDDEDGETTKYYYPDYIEPEVKLIDKDGVEAVTDKDLEFSVSDSKIARIDAAGRVWPANADAEGVVTVTVVNTKHRLVASTEVRIGDVGGVGIEFDVPETLLVGEDYTIGMKVIGNDGKKYMKDADYSAVVISKPEGATVEVDVYDDELEVYSDTKGEVKIVVTAREDNESVSGTLTLSFVEEPEKVAEGKVVLTIGSDIGFVDGVPTELDAPAFIEDGRTFVPVRFLAEAVGAEADWEPKDAAVETVYLTWEDMQIIIKIGEEALTVVKDGEEEVVTFDGAARIVNGRTFLPFRAIGEAIGLEVDYGPKDGPVKWVSYN